MNKTPRVVVFDLDDTLAPSKTAVPLPMVELLAKLLDRVDVCIISGAGFDQFLRQVLSRFPEPSGLQRLHIMPTCGTRYVRWQDGQWKQLFAQDLSTSEKEHAIAVLESGARALGLWETHTWGPVVEDRGSQITYSALGQSAPLAAKAAWDPGGKKKASLRDHVSERLPGLEVRSGGSTSIDVTMKGVDKAHGVRELCRAMDVGLGEVLFVGDRLDPGGNDYPVKEMGVECIQVADWHDTAEQITSIIEHLSASQVPSAADPVRVRGS